MKIQPINFKSNWTIFSYDDESSKKDREYIREHLEAQFEDDKIRNSGRLDEYELNQLIKSFILNSSKHKKKQEENPEIDEEMLEEAKLINFESLYGNNSYRASLDNITSKQLEIIKQAGIRHIVDLRRYSEPIECEDIEYLHFPIANTIYDENIDMSEEEYIKKQMDYAIYDYSYSPDKNSEYIESYRQRYQKQKRQFNDEFVKFIQTMQKGNVLIGCEYGTYTTDYALQLDFFFNPKADIISQNRDKYFGVTMRIIYENLSADDKKAMGWDEDFDKNFIKRLEDYGYWTI